MSGLGLVLIPAHTQTHSLRITESDVAALGQCASLHTQRRARDGVTDVAGLRQCASLHTRPKVLQGKGIVDSNTFGGLTVANVQMKACPAKGIEA